MYKYAYYIGVLLWTLVRKALGLLWYWVLPVWLRAPARNAVFNYALQGGVYIKRLTERPITPIYHEGILAYYDIAPYHGTKGGWIIARHVSRWEFLLWYWFVWGWVDDDSNQDTYSLGFNNTIINKERKAWLPQFIRDELADIPPTRFGNSFDLGDVRGANPALNFWATTLWTLRNTAYNFKYVQWVTDDPRKVFLWEPIEGVKFGWVLERPGSYKLVFWR